MQILFLELSFPSVKDFLRISEVCFRYPFVGNSIMFPLTFVHKSIVIVVFHTSLFNNFDNFIFLWVFSQLFQVCPIIDRIRAEGLEVCDAEDGVNRIGVR